MRYILVFIITIFLSYSANSQAPGYLGKRFVIGVGIGVKPSLIDYVEDNELILNTTPELSVSYVINKKNSLGLKFNYFKSENYGSSIYLEDNTKFSLNNYTSSSIGVGFEIKTFSPDFIAPIGAYRTVSFAVYRTTSDDFLTGASKSQFINYFGPASYRSINTTNIAYFIGISRGKKFIIYDMFGFDISWFLGLTINEYSFKSGLISDFLGNNYIYYTSASEEIEGIYQIDATNNIKNHFSFGLKLKIDMVL